MQSARPRSYCEIYILFGVGTRRQPASSMPLESCQPVFGSTLLSNGRRRVQAGAHYDSRIPFGRDFTTPQKGYGREVAVSPCNKNNPAVAFRETSATHTDSSFRDGHADRTSTHDAPRDRIARRPDRSRSGPAAADAYCGLSAVERAASLKKARLQSAIYAYRRSRTQMDVSHTNESRHTPCSP